MSKWKIKHEKFDDFAIGKSGKKRIKRDVSDETREKIRVKVRESNLEKWSDPNFRKQRVSSLEKVLSQFREKHGDKYDYSKVEYVNAHTEITIICKEHGEFRQKPHNHKTGSSCPSSPKKKRKKVQYSEAVLKLRDEQKKLRDEERLKKVEETKRQKYPDIVAELKKIHGDKYDYSKVEYVDYGTPLTIICPKHGEYHQIFYHHRKGHGCPKCGNKISSQKQTFSQEKVIASFKRVHGDKYDYSKVVYVRNYEKVIIICPEHGEFLQAPSGHKSGQGCVKCGHKQRLKVWKKGKPNKNVSKG